MDMKTKDNNNGDSVDDNLHSAFQEFMMKGRHGGSTMKNVPPVSNNPSPLSPSKKSTKNVGENKNKKDYIVILKAFQARLLDWKEINGELQNLLLSIDNLRDRIQFETTFLLGSPGVESEKCDIGSAKPWQNCGLRRVPGLSSFPLNFTSATSLVFEDVQSALDHDLLQHEKMLASLRRLMAFMAQNLDAMGRRLDEWLLQDLLSFSYRHQLRVDEDISVWLAEQLLLEEVKSLYNLLGEDLYWKQSLVQAVLKSSHDGIIEEKSTQMCSYGNPGRVVKRAVKEWSRFQTGHIDTLTEKLLNVPY